MMAQKPLSFTDAEAVLIRLRRDVEVSAGCPIHPEATPEVVWRLATLMRGFDDDSPAALSLDAVLDMVNERLPLRAALGLEAAVMKVRAEFRLGTLDIHAARVALLEVARPYPALATAAQAFFDQPHLQVLAGSPPPAPAQLPPPRPLRLTQPGRAVSVA